MNTERRNIRLRQALPELQKAVDAQVSKANALTADSVIRVMVDFYQKIQIQSLEEANDGDMLLFQYGSYNWSDEEGLKFELSVVRQLMIARKWEDELHQLELRLLYSPSEFEGIEAVTLWKAESAESWLEKVRATEGFKRAQKQVPYHYTVRLKKI
jgi:hypothetical protein